MINNFILTILILLVGNILCKGQKLPAPQIHYEDAILSVELNTDVIDSFKISKVDVQICYPVSGFREIENIPIGNNGTFQVKLPMLCEGFSSFRLGYTPIILGVVPGKETKAYVSLDDKKKLKVTTDNPLNFACEDIIEAMMFDWEYMQTPLTFRERPTLQNLLEDVVSNEKNMLNKIDSSSLSVSGKTYARYAIKLNSIIILLDHKRGLRREHQNWLAANKKTEEESSYQVPEADITYYSFLKKFNLNDPYYLYSEYYGGFLTSILEDEIMNIPPINEQPIEEWMKQIAGSLKEVTGFDSGLFYDVLAVSAYYQYLSYKKPLTEIQKKNITTYFTNRSYVDYLFAENEYLLKVLQRDASKKVSIQPTPQVPENELLNTIIKEHKGKVVFVDFWATWCAPCLFALKECESIKSEEFQGKDVVYIYITSTTSPHKRWEAKIKEIEGEHYYLNDDSFSTICDQLGFSAIPTSLIYDKNGMLKHKKTTMSKAEICQWINELL